MQVVVDYECRSEADLNALGAVEYAKHPSTEIICAGYKINDKPAKIWKPGEPPNELLWALVSGTVVAHNAGFENAITKYVLNRLHIIKVKPRWRCTAAKAAALALPRDLERASGVMQLAVQKDMEGNRLIKKYMKPRRKWKEWKENFDKGDAFDWEEPEKYFNDPEELSRIYKYCLTDVETEYLLDKALPHLPPNEEQIWVLNQEMNLRGIQIDIETVKLILNLINHQTKNLNEELQRLTDGAVKTANQRDKFLSWIEEQGDYLSNLQEGSVKAALEAKTLKPNVQRALEIRQSLSKASTKKYQAMITRAGSDGRVRDIGMYHGDHTGRESGTGIQVKNLPKGKIKNTDQAIEVIQTGDLEYIEMLYGDAFEVFSSCLRGMITATPGSMIYDADYNAIECRILNWLAGETEVLNDFKNGVDLYVKMANRIGSDNRQLGKTIELASGFQMGAAKLHQTCIDWGVNGGKGITEDEAEKAIQAYRKSHPNVVKFWGAMERAAIYAVRNPDKVVRTRHGINFGMWKKFLWCELPGGKRLYYFGPEVRQEPTPWGEFRPKLYHWHIENTTKQWVCSATYGGKICENIVQATARNLMFDAALRLKSKGYNLMMTIHDEIVAESKAGSVEEYENILMQKPAWAKGLPIAVKGWTKFRFRKV